MPDRHGPHCLKPKHQWTIWELNNLIWTTSSLNEFHIYLDSDDFSTGGKVPMEKGNILWLLREKHMHLGITQWRCLHRVLRKYINNTKSLVKLFFPSVCGCLWVLSSHARHLCFSRLQKKIVVSRLHLSIYLFVCSKENVVSCLHLYIFFVYSKKNVVFITSRTRNGRMSITVQYITILS